MDQAGLRTGDVLEAAGGQPLTGMPDWFVARAHFERDRPIDLQIQRNGQHLRLHLMITDPSLRTWNKAQRDSVLALYLARLILLVLAILIAFSRSHQQLSARLAALMLAVGAVAEGYPSSGWAAGLQRLPAVLAIPICLASVSCVLAPIMSFGFCVSFSRVRFSQRWQRLVVLVPTVLFGIPLVASSIAMIYAPSLLARPWPKLLSLAPVRLIEDTAGVTPLLFLSVWPFYRPTMHAWLLQLWLATAVLYFVAGCLILFVRYCRAESRQERRRVGALCAVSILFGLIILHNIFVRNWTGWFGSAPPALFSAMSFVAEAILFVPVPLTLTYCVLDQCKFNKQTQERATTPAT